MSDETNILSLPVEILREICSYLVTCHRNWKYLLIPSYRALCSLMLVSRKFKEVGEDPRLWRNFTLKLCGCGDVTCDYVKNLELLNMKRLTALKCVKITAFRKNTMTIFKSISLKPNIKCLEINDLNILDVDKDTFVNTLTTIESISLTDDKRGNSAAKDFYREKLIKVLFNKMTEKTNVKNITLRNQPIAGVDPHIFAKSLNCLEVVDLRGSISSRSVEQLFSLIIKETNIKKLTVMDEYFDLCSIDSNIFAQSVNKLEELKLECNGPPCETQLAAFFEQCAIQTNLKKLWLCADLTTVDSDVFARAVNNIVKFCFPGKLTSKQTEKIFEYMDEESKIKDLVLHPCNLKDVNPEILENCLKKLKKMNILTTILNKGLIEDINDIVADRIDPDVH